MEDEQEGDLFRPPQTPFEVELLTEQILTNLGYKDLQNCRLVSRSWKRFASKSLKQLIDTVRQVQCRLVPSEDTLQGALQNKQQLFQMENGQELLDLVRSRNLLSSFHETLPPFRFSYETPNVLKDFDSQLYHFGDNRESANFFSSSYSKTLEAFLSNPIISDLVDSVTFDRRFDDLRSVLGILEKLPRLKELKLKFEPQLCREILGPDWQFQESEEGETSMLRKLELEFVRETEEIGAESPIWGRALEVQVQKYISAIFKVCGNLKTLRLLDSITTFDPMTPFNLKFFTSFKQPQSLEELEIQSLRMRKLQNLPQKLHLLSIFQNLKSLDLRSWACLPLADWNHVAIDSQLLPNLESLRLRLHHSSCPQQLLFDGYIGSVRRCTLKSLSLDSTWGDTHPFQHYRWNEEWNSVQPGEPLTLTSAMLFPDEITGRFVDLSSFPHLTHLSLVFPEEGGMQQDRIFGEANRSHMLNLTWKESEPEPNDQDSSCLTMTDASIYSLDVDWHIDFKSVLWSQYLALRVRKRALAAALAAAPSAVKHLEISLSKNDFIFVLSENCGRSGAGEHSEVSGAVDGAQLAEFCVSCRDESVAKCVYSRKEKKLRFKASPETGPIWRPMESENVEDNRRPCCDFVMVLMAGVT